MMTMSSLLDKYRREYTYLRCEAVEDFLHEPEAFISEDAKYITVDIETYAKKEHADEEYAATVPAKSRIRTLQIYDGARCFILDFKRPDDSYMLLDKNIVKDLQTFLTSKQTVAHNAIFETSFFQYVFSAHFHKVKPLNILCSMNMFNLIKSAVDSSCDLKKSSLKELVYTYLDVVLPKDAEQTKWGIELLSSEQLDYCMLDVVPLWYVVPQLLKTIKNLDMVRVLEINTSAQEPVAHMRIHGIGIDRDRHKRLIDQWKQKRDKLEIECYSDLNRDKDFSDAESILLDGILKPQIPFIRGLCVSLKGVSDITTFVSDLKLCKTLLNKEEKGDRDAKKLRALRRVIKNIEKFITKPSSTKDKANWFLGNAPEEDLATWPVSEKTGLLKVDKYTLADLTHIDAADTINQYSIYDKLHSTYGVGLDNFLVDKRGATYIYPNYTLCSTHTGRMSSYKPNLQNLPRDKDVRAMFIPRGKDRVLVCADFSQVELRIAALISRDEVMLEAYEQGKDLHSITASNMSGKPESSITKEERQHAKACGFGLLFGAGANTLRKYAQRSYGVEMSVDDAEKAVNIFRDTYKGYRHWQVTTAKSAEATLMSYTPSGKVRALHEDMYYTTSMNTPIQGGAGEVTLISLSNMWEYIQEHDIDAYIVNVIHDEIILDVVEKDAEEATKALEQSMINGMLEVFPEATTLDLVEAKQGKNWAEAK